MSESAKNPFDLLLAQFREIVREELRAAMSEGKNETTQRDWLRAGELQDRYNLPKTWFEERGRAGDIARTKPGRYVLFNRHDVEAYLQGHKRKKGEEV